MNRQPMLCQAPYTHKLGSELFFFLTLVPVIIPEVTRKSLICHFQFQYDQSLNSIDLSLKNTRNSSKHFIYCSIHFPD